MKVSNLHHISPDLWSAGLIWRMDNWRFLGTKIRTAAKQTVVCI